MKKNEIKKIRITLEKERKNLLEDVERIKEREKSYLNDEVGDEADKAAGNSQREILFYLNDNERFRVDAIEDAIQKINEGRYGLCEKCGKKITKDRLKAIPYARLCIKCKPADEENS